jgi:hypothetical protein
MPAPAVCQWPKYFWRQQTFELLLLKRELQIRGSLICGQCRENARDPEGASVHVLLLQGAL